MNGTRARFGRVWERLKRIVLIATFVLFTAFGVVILAVGDGSERWVGLLLVLFFGLGGSAYVFMPLVGRRMDPVETRPITHRGASRSALVFPVARGRVLLGALAGLGFAGAGAIMFAVAGEFGDPGEDPTGARIAGGICAVFGLLVAAVGFRNAGIGPSYLALLPDGILYATGLGSSYVAWDDVVDASLFEIRGAVLMGIRVRDPRAIQTRVPRWLLSTNRWVSPFDLAFPAATMPVDAEALERTIRHYLARPEARRDLGTPASEARLGAAGEPRG